MNNTYLNQFFLPSVEDEDTFLIGIRRTCYNGYYPFRFMKGKQPESFEFGPVTILYGGNGSGKSTILNVIAQRLDLIRHSVFNSSAFFSEYVSMCRFEGKIIPENSQILTSDDVFDYLLNMRYINDGIDFRREELFQEWVEKSFSKPNMNCLDDYDKWKEFYDAKRMTQSRFVKERLMKNVDIHSNGESALRYFTDHINEHTLYLLDEPENSLAFNLQKELAEFISASARFYGCQFIIATHSPVLLALKDAVIYDLDKEPVATRKWTELGNVREMYEFFEEHREDFFEK